MAVDSTQVKLYRRYVAFREFEPTLGPAHEIPRDEHVMRLYELAGQRIGRDTPIRYLEFGVATGGTMRLMSAIFSNSESEFIGFDSFEGLPEAWEHHVRGTFSTDGASPRIDDPRIRFVKGWFQNTVPGFLKELRGQPHKTTLVHFDADLYSSTLFLLATLWFDIPEYYFIFDEFHYDEVYSLHDFASAFPVKIEFLGKTIGPMQVFGKLTRTEFSLT